MESPNIHYPYEFEISKLTLLIVKLSTVLSIGEERGNPILRVSWSDSQKISLIDPSDLE